MNFLKRKKIKFTDLDRVTDNTESTNKKKCFENKAVSDEDLGKCYGSASPNDPALREKYKGGCC